MPAHYAALCCALLQVAACCGNIDSAGAANHTWHDLFLNVPRVATYLNSYVTARAYCKDNVLVAYILLSMHSTGFPWSHAISSLESEGRGDNQLRRHNKSLSCCSFPCKEPSEHLAKVFAQYCPAMLQQLVQTVYLWVFFSRALLNAALKMLLG